LNANAPPRLTAAVPEDIEANEYIPLADDDEPIGHTINASTPALKGVFKKSPYAIPSNQFLNSVAIIQCL